MDFSAHPVYIPLSSLIEELREYGFIIGVDTWQDVYRLLQDAPFTAAKSTPEQLKTCLCPLFAVNEEQQALFYRLFDKHFGLYSPGPPAHPAAGSFSRPPRKSMSKEERRLIINYSSLAVALVTICWFLIRLWFFYHPIFERISFNPPGIPKMPQQYDADTLGDTPSTARPPVIPPAEAKEKKMLRYLSIYDPDPSYFEMKEFWKYRFRILFVEGGIWLVLGGCSVWLIIILYRRNRQKIIRERQEQREPLSYWPVRTEEQVHVQLPHEFFQAANSLRRRLHFVSPQLDMPATVLATISAGGRPSPRFRQHSRPAEYLVLLPDENEYSMFTRYCEFIFGLLGKTDLILHCYYYRGSPERFYQRKGEKEVSTQALLYHHGNARLLLVMLPEAAERLSEKTASAFYQWDDRALLLSGPLQQGTAQEKLLQDEFLLYPASVGSLARLVDRWEQDMEADTDFTEPPQPFISEHYALKTQLLDYFKACATGSSPDDLLRWLAACCLYPELHWDLVLYIGRQLPVSGAPLLRLENLEALCRISWFASGVIPANVRDQLIHDETILDDALRDQLLKAIRELVEQNMPQEEASLVYDRRKLHLSVLDALLSESERSKRKRMRDLLRAEEQAGEPEGLATILLQRYASTPLNRMLSENMQQHLYRDGKKYKGWKTIWTTVLIAVLATGILLLIDTAPVTGNLETYNGKSYFIDNAEKQATWQNHKASFYYNPYYPGASPYATPGSTEHQKALTMLDSASAAAENHPATLLNHFIVQLNYELIRINELKLVTAGRNLEQMEKDLAAIADRLAADSTQQGAAAGSLPAHYALVKTNYWFARWLCYSAAGQETAAALALKQVDRALLEENQVEMLERRENKK